MINEKSVKSLMKSQKIEVKVPEFPIFDGQTEENKTEKKVSAKPEKDALNARLLKETASLKYLKREVEELEKGDRPLRIIRRLSFCRRDAYRRNFP